MTTLMLYVEENEDYDGNGPNKLFLNLGYGAYQFDASNVVATNFETGAGSASDVVYTTDAGETWSTPTVTPDIAPTSYSFDPNVGSVGTVYGWAGGGGLLEFITSADWGQTWTSKTQTLIVGYNFGDVYATWHGGGTTHYILFEDTLNNLVVLASVDSSAPVPAVYLDDCLGNTKYVVATGEVASNKIRFVAYLDSPPRYYYYEADGPGGLIYSLSASLRYGTIANQHLFSALGYDFMLFIDDQFDGVMGSTDNFASYIFFKSQTRASPEQMNTTNLAYENMPDGASKIIKIFDADAVNAKTYVYFLQGTTMVPVASFEGQGTNGAQEDGCSFSSFFIHRGKLYQTKTKEIVAINMKVRGGWDTSGEMTVNNFELEEAPDFFLILNQESMQVSFVGKTIGYDPETKTLTAQRAADSDLNHKVNRNFYKRTTDEIIREVLAGECWAINFFNNGIAPDSTVRSINFKNRPVGEIMRWFDAVTGRFSYLSNVSIFVSPAAPLATGKTYGFRDGKLTNHDARIVNRKAGEIYIRGGEGKFSYVRQDGAGIWWDYFPEINDQAELDAIALKKAAENNIKSWELDVDILDDGFLLPWGQTIEFSLEPVEPIPEQTFYIIRSSYNAQTGSNHLLISDSLYYPLSDQSEGVSVENAKTEAEISSSESTDRPQTTFKTDSRKKLRYVVDWTLGSEFLRFDRTFKETIELVDTYQGRNNCVKTKNNLGGLSRWFLDLDEEEDYLKVEWAWLRDEDNPLLYQQIAFALTDSSDNEVIRVDLNPSGEIQVSNGVLTLNTGVEMLQDEWYVMSLEVVRNGKVRVFISGEYVGNAVANDYPISRIAMISGVNVWSYWDSLAFSPLENFKIGSTLDRGVAVGERSVWEALHSERSALVYSEQQHTTRISPGNYKPNGSPDWYPTDGLDGWTKVEGGTGVGTLEVVIEDGGHKNPLHLSFDSGAGTVEAKSLPYLVLGGVGPADGWVSWWLKSDDDVDVDFYNHGDAYVGTISYQPSALYPSVSFAGQTIYINNAGDWHHILVEYDGASQDISLYVDMQLGAQFNFGASFVVAYAKFKLSAAGEECYIDSFSYTPEHKRVLSLGDGSVELPSGHFDCLTTGLSNHSAGFWDSCTQGIVDGSTWLPNGELVLSQASEFSATGAWTLVDLSSVLPQNVEEIKISLHYRGPAAGASSSEAVGLRFTQNTAYDYYYQTLMYADGYHCFADWMPIIDRKFYYWRGSNVTSMLLVIWKLRVTGFSNQSHQLTQP